MKYAPARPDGTKPYVVTLTEWGRQRTKVVYAVSAADAKSRAVNRMRYTYVVKCLRATPDVVAGESQ